ncbi:phosphoribosylaminoimidazolesuccinocarboxamide synthase [Actinomadura terrae]|uniref:phosphoribosylaminoimidazolesuccinocarboxamide synthase n=1 Tax=Actinomadura terrae TaxID=604353 RepID=UPI001FA75B17|nr:phosphoribosylaminoimidazolesuccinocarboxamide synthase [Actinomadura terrae]
MSETRPPDVTGHSKKIWKITDGDCYVQLVPSLSSFTFDRHELMGGTDALRLDFYERAAARLAGKGVQTAFLRRVDATSYLARYVTGPPFEVIVKNYAVGSTVRKYPGLFNENEPLPRPVVKFDYRIDPEDQPIGEDYLRALGLPVEGFRANALAVNRELRDWLAPLELWDFCLIFGLTEAGQPVITSEISPDCMRLRRSNGSSLDKDLFRQGASAEQIITEWRKLIDELE